MATSLAEQLARDVAAAHSYAGRPLLIALASAQGAGKTTLAAELGTALAREHRLRAHVLSLDDFYLTRGERERLARDLHPLLVTRGVPGTHDLPLAHRTLDALLSATERDVVLCPRFDKAVDDRTTERDWSHARGPLDMVVLEGWCLGATPEHEPALRVPVNALERDEDSDGRFRRHVNAQLAGPYRSLFARIDRLVFLAAPSMDVVLDWRTEQERALIAAHVGTAARAMDDAALARFVQHFERLTRHMLATMPTHADVVVRLDAQRCVRGVATRTNTGP